MVDLFRAAAPKLDGLSEMSFNGLARQIFIQAAIIGSALQFFPGDAKGQLHSAPQPVPEGSVAVDHMSYGRCYVGSEVSLGLGGNGTSYNMPIDLKITGLVDSLIQPDSVQLITDRNKDSFGLFIINTTKTPVAFNAQDSRLSIVQQALGPDGVWRDIEYLVSSWCGNSYHSLALESGQAWYVDAPRYYGSYETKLRFKLEQGSYEPLVDKAEVEATSESAEQYSDEFIGSVNPGQFFITEGQAGYFAIVKEPPVER